LKNIILGTAGHVDHGKTSLVKYLSGIDTDRLKEEQRRGITIELGFAPFTLPDGQRVGIVDVPGHEKFIKNMLAGSSGIDIVLFVIAADEGVMPQTKEHMDILMLLGIKRGVIALTKCDMVDDEWLELVREDVSEFISGSPLQDAPIIPVSSVTGDGINELLDAIGAMCRDISVRSSEGNFRLAIDRSFVMPGFGTVVTGTVWGGRIKTGDPIEVFPKNLEAKVRSLQVHGEKREDAFAGERTAINIRGLEKASAERGGWIAAPGVLRESHRVDVSIDSLKDSPVITQRMRVHLHHGTVEVLARVVLLGQESLEPGNTCFAQLELESPLPMLPGDKFVLRFYSPMYTIAGGTILDPLAQKYKTRSIQNAIRRLESLRSGDPAKFLPITIAESRRLWPMEKIKALLRNYDADAQSIVEEMIVSGTLVSITGEFYFPAQALEELCGEVKEYVGNHHKKHPLRFGVPKKELVQDLAPDMDKKEQKALFSFLELSGDFKQEDIIISLKDWEPVITEKQREIIDAVLKEYSQAGFMPPPWSELSATGSLPEPEKDALLFWFLRSGNLVKLADDAVYSTEIIRKAEEKLREIGKEFSLAEARDTLGTSRKYAQQLCDYLDNAGITYWDGVNHFWKN